MMKKKSTRRRGAPRFKVGETVYIDLWSEGKKSRIRIRKDIWDAFLRIVEREGKTPNETFQALVDAALRRLREDEQLDRLGVDRISSNARG